MLSGTISRENYWIQQRTRKQHQKIRNQLSQQGASKCFLIRKGIRVTLCFMHRQLEESGEGQIRKKHPKTRAEKQSQKQRWSHFQLHWKKPSPTRNAAQQYSRSKAQCCSRAERKKRGRTETEDVAQIPPNPTAKRLQTPSHSLPTEAQSQSTTQHFRRGIPFLHNCAHTPNPATPELPPKDTLSSQSVQTLTSTTAKKENKYFPFF